jgi:hypothetical protein
MDSYWRRRVVSYAAYHIRLGRDMQATIEYASRRRPPIPEEHIRQAWAEAVQSVENSRRVSTAAPWERLCDIKGCKYPGGI